MYEDVHKCEIVEVVKATASNHSDENWKILETWHRGRVRHGPGTSDSDDMAGKCRALRIGPPFPASFPTTVTLSENFHRGFKIVIISTRQGVGCTPQFTVLDPVRISIFTSFRNLTAS